MDILLSIIPAFIFFAQSVFLKIYGNSCHSKGANDNFFAFIYFIISTAIITPFMLSNVFHIESLIFGVAFGCGITIMLYCYGRALHLGGIATSNFILAMALLIPVIGMAVIYGEVITLWQYIALAIFIVAFYLICLSKNKKDSKFNARALVYQIISAVASGSLGLLIKVGYNEVADFSQYSFLFIGFLTASLLNIFIYLITSKSRKKLPKYKYTKEFFICAVFVALTTSLGNIAVTNILPLVSIAIFYPISNGGQVLISAAFSPLFKEKLSLRVIAGIILGIIAIVLLGL